MLGSEVPDLSQTPCPHCAQPFRGGEGEEVRWDPWHRADSRWAALPYHQACAEAAGVLPPVEPGPDQRSCGRCETEIEPADLAKAYAALHARFLAAKASLVQVELVWRVASRDPRSYVPEHFACILGAFPKKKSRRIDPEPELLGGDLGPEQG